VGESWVGGFIGNVFSRLSRECTVPGNKGMRGTQIDVVIPRRMGIWYLCFIYTPVVTFFYSFCRFWFTHNVEAFFTKTDIAYHLNPSKKTRFGWYAISVFFKNASILRVERAELRGASE